MNTTLSKTPAHEAAFPAGTARLLRACAEGCVLFLVAASPWAFGGVHPLSELVLYAVLGLALLLWAARLLVEGSPLRIACPVSLCLAGMVLLGVTQIVPLPQAWVARLAPGAADLRTRLAPSRLEVLPDGSFASEAAGDHGLPLSLYPGGTREAVVRLLAVFALFVLVRNNVASPEAVRRLAVVALVNGALLSLLALVQHFTSPHHVIYWHWETQGQAFGPFICRNHFPFYVNACLALGLGMLIALRPGGAKRSGHGLDSWGSRFADLGHRPASLWIAAALALLFASVAVSLSRGGLVALVGAALVCAFVRFLAARKLGGYGAALLLGLVPGIGLAAWFGAERVERRVATLWEGDALGEGRVPLWTRMLPRVAEAPVWGSGYGTFEWVEPRGRTPAEATNLAFDHAHNEYLEALVEGGMIQLALGLAAVGFVVRAAWQAYRPSARRPNGDLALGALFAFMTLAIHSFTDFGLHVPANAVLATVLAAHLTALAPAESAPSLPGYPVRIATAGAVLVVALLLAVEGWKAERAERFRLAAGRCLDRATPEGRKHALTYLTEALRFAPDRVALRMRLAEVHEAAYADERAGLAHARRAAAAMTAVGDSTLNGLPFLYLSALDADSWHVAEEPRLVRRHLLPALRQYATVRDHCPLLAEAHVRLAAYAQHFATADRPREYFARACFLAPADARTWYLAGAQALDDGREADAHDGWRHSLLCSERHLGDILARTAGRSDAAQIFADVLADDGGRLIRAVDSAAAELPPDARRTLLAALERLQRPLAPEELHAKARLHQDLDEPEQAERALRAALAASPERSDWRRELDRHRRDSSLRP